MKRFFAVALFLMLFASSALADGPGQEPPQSGVVQLADGGGLEPPAQSGVVQLADGSGQEPPQAATQSPLVSVAA
jgi:hypothetical protein